MRIQTKPMLIGIGATLFMAFAVTTAAARNLSVSSEGIRATFASIELGIEGFTPMTCRLTLEGSFHSRTISKASETLIGSVTRVNFGNCSNITVLTATLPWHLRYSGFSGRLPNITLLLLKIGNVSFNWDLGSGLRCLTTTELETRFSRNSATGEVNSAEIPSQVLPFTSGGGFGCPTTEGFLRSSGNGSVTLLGTANKLTVTLI